MKNGTVKISCALAALALVITAGLSGCGANSGDANSATQQSSASGQNNEAGKKSVVKTPDLSKISWNVDPAAEGIPLVWLFPIPMVLMWIFLSSKFPTA